IKKSGGFITWNSLGQPNVNGRLAMTRSIGDFDLKKMGVIAEPETKRVTLHHVHDSFLALTTDGINFIMNSQEICNVINQCHDPKEAAQRISDQVKNTSLTWKHKHVHYQSIPASPELQTSIYLIRILSDILFVLS
ncbi:Protein phosphatase 1K, mitochondrial, partial [Xenoophorus captivus]